MGLVEQFNEVEKALPERWGDANFLLTVADDGSCDRAAALLGPANPGRLGKNIRFATGRRGGAVTPDGMRRLLARLDQEGIDARLELVGSEEAAPEELREQAKLRDQWEDELAGLPADWSDVYAEVRLDSTDFLDRGALLLSPINPARYGGPTGFRFRAASRFGYGASAAMVARCFERCDEEGLTGEVEILRSLSDTFPVGTQGPVWYVDGRAV